MPTLQQFIGHGQSHHSNFCNTNYSLELHQYLAKKKGGFKLNEYQSEHSPYDQSVTDENTIIKQFESQAFQMSVNNQHNYICTCNPYNHCIPATVKSYELYLTSPQTFIHYIAQRLDANQTKGMFKLIHLYAIKHTISDVHVIQKETMCTLLFRKNKTIYLECAIHQSLGKKLITLIKLNGHIDISITKKPQDGAYHFSSSNQDQDIRISTLPTHFGETVSLRLFNAVNQFNTFQSLGFNHTKVAAINKMITKPNGLILITGPTGAGKSTTLYTMLKTMAKQKKHIITLEDPIEQVYPAILQSAITDHYNFEKGFKAIIEKSPTPKKDINIGEIIFHKEIPDVLDIM